MRGLGSNRKLRVAICGMLSGRKRRIAREACRADCPSWKPCGVVPAGTGEGISARIHAANSQGDKAEEGRRSARRHNANSLGVRVESCVSLVAGIVVGVSRARGVESSIIICKARNVKNADCQWVHHPTCHPRTLPGRAASGGALATEPPRATHSPPEIIHIITKTTRRAIKINTPSLRVHLCCRDRFFLLPQRILFVATTGYFCCHNGIFIYLLCQ